MHDRVSRAAVFLAAFIFTGISFAIFTTSTSAQTPEFNIIKPSTTGIPGEEVRVMKFDPAGNLWVAARWPFWGESGLAMLSADQLQHDPLPGGGFDTGAWRVWSSVHHPQIPTPYTYDIEFATDGTIWVANEGGLIRFRPNAATKEAMWHVYSNVNTPMLYPDVRSIQIDAAGNIWVVNSNIQDYNYGELWRLNPTTEQWTHFPIQAPGGGTIYKPYSVNIAANGDVLIALRTFGGLARYNGTAWTIVPPPAPALDFPFEDTQGNVWGHSSGDGLWKWNGTSWQHWPVLSGTSDMSTIGMDRNGVVHVVTWGGDIYKMINNQPVFTGVNAGPIVGAFIGRPNGEIWITNYGGNGHVGTVRHYTENLQLLERLNGMNTGLGDYFIDRIRSDSAGNLWFMSGENGLSRMLGSDGSRDRPTRWRNWGNHNFQSQPYPWAGNEPMFSVFEEGNGIFWLGGNGVGRWDSNTGQLTNFWNWQNSAVDAAGVHDIVKRGDAMWIGMGGSGVMRLNGNTWTRVLLSDPWAYVHNDVRAMAVDTGNNLWVGSSFGLRKFAAGDDTNFTLYHRDNSGMPDSSILDVMADPRGGVWVGTGEGLGRFDGTNWTVYNRENTGMPGKVVTDVARRASDGLIAIASVQGGSAPYTGGVSTFDGQTWRHYTPQNSPLTHWQVEAVEFDREGHLWASAISQGVVEILLEDGRDAPFDFDGDGRTDLSIFRGSDGSWWYERSSNGTTGAVAFGTATDKLTPADFTGDGKTDLTFFRPETGQWFILRSEDSSFFAFPFGTSGDIPHPADYDGDGRADAAVFRPSSSTWFIRRSGDGGTTIKGFGSAGDVPVAADYDGDGKTDIAIYRPSLGQWWIDRSSAGTIAYGFGTASDRTVAGDYTGDGKADVAFWRPSTGQWFILRSEDSSYFAVPFGNSADQPAPGDYDGDGKFDTAVFRPSAATWYVDRSTSGALIRQFGSNGDTAVPGVVVR